MTLKEIIRDQARAELCRRKFSFFVKEFWACVVPNELVWNWHMDTICDEYQAVMERVFTRSPKEYDIIFNVPPGTSKTMLISVMGTAWDFCRMPAIRDFVGSYSDSAVSGIADNLKIVMKSDKYTTYFPEVVIRKDKDSLHNFKTTANGEFYAFTVGGTITSKHGDSLKVDDPLNPKRATSSTFIEDANHFMDQTLSSRKVDKNVTPTMLIMQRLDQDDPTGHILAQGGSVRHICLPGEVSDKVSPPELKEKYIGGLLDPNRLNKKTLDELKLKLGSYGYSGQIMQSPAPAGGEIWQKWFIPIDDDKFPTRSMLLQYGTDWDTAYTKDEENAANAYFTAGKIKNQIYIDDFDFAWLEFPQLVKWMKTKPAPHYVEAKASGKSIKQVVSSMGIPVIEVKVNGGGDKIARARSVTPTAEAGMVCIRKSLLDKLYYDEKQGILQFPKSKYKDVADALAQCISRLKTKGIVSASGSEPSHRTSQSVNSDKDLLDAL